METFFDRQILLSMRKRMVKEDSLVAESITSNFKYSHQPGKRKKTFVSSGKFITRWKKKKKVYITCLSCASFKVKPFLLAEKIPSELWTNTILLRNIETRVTSLFQYWCHFLYQPLRKEDGWEYLLRVRESIIIERAVMCKIQSHLFTADAWNFIAMLRLIKISE